MKSTYSIGQIISQVIPFCLALGMAWYFDWSSKDLIWSLWLSSLTVGLLIILWGSLCTLYEKVAFALKSLKKRLALPRNPFIWLLYIIVALVGLIYLCVVTAFISFHFSTFHILHAVFLNHFFPVLDVDTTPFPPHNMMEFKTIYWPVISQYIVFVPVAIWSQREAFRPSEGFNVIGPYKNVIKMHLLIFFFAAVTAMHVENFWVYAVVYSLYFFPWEVLRKKREKGKK